MEILIDLWAFFTAFCKPPYNHSKMFSGTRQMRTDRPIAAPPQRLLRIWSRAFGSHARRRDRADDRGSGRRPAAGGRTDALPDHAVLAAIECRAGQAPEAAGSAATT